MALTNKNAYDCLAKILLIGDSSVGKTNLTLRFCDNEFKPSYISTIGIDFRIRTILINGSKVKTQVWDTAGQERFRTITTAYYRGAHGILLVYDITNRQTFSNINNWLNQLKLHSRENIALILVGNKTDLESNRQVSFEEGQNKANEFGCNFYETSCKSAENVETCFISLVTQIYNTCLKEKYGESEEGTTLRLEGEKKTKSTCCS